MHTFTYSNAARELQDRFDTRKLADAELAVIVHDQLNEPDKAFIKSADDPALVGRFPGAQFAVRVAITALITNCPRYIPRMTRTAGSRYVPHAVSGAQHIPGWKRIDAIQGVLPARDQNKAESVGGLISMDQWGQLVAEGDPLA